MSLKFKCRNKECCTDEFLCKENQHNVVTISIVKLKEYPDGFKTYTTRCPICCTDCFSNSSKLVPADAKINKEKKVKINYEDWET